MIGIKIYPSLRTAMIEQCSDIGRKIPILYRNEYYDFHEDIIVDGNITIKRKNFFQTILDLFFNSYDKIEMTEPLFIREVPINLIYTLVIKLRDIIIRRKTHIVFYCIENVDIQQKIKHHAGFANVFIWLLFKASARFLIRNSSNIAFGTNSAFSEYIKLFPTELASKATRTFSVAEEACRDCVIKSKEEASFIFVGSFDERKGILTLMDFWPSFAQDNRTSHLTIIGKGKFLPQVREWCLDRKDVTLIVDPPRREIHRQLCMAETLILPSKGDHTWREQIGLPIQEGLSHGCRIIATEETGAADYLEERGHLVVPNLIGSQDVIYAWQCQSPNFLAIMSALPKIGGRKQAEKWMWSVAR